MEREYIAWDSPTLGRRMELLWFGHGGRADDLVSDVAGDVLPERGLRPGRRGRRPRSSGARSRSAASTASTTRASTRRRNIPPRGSGVTTSTTRYIANEIVPFARARGRHAGRMATLGASFGAYHAANFGFRHPDLVDKIVAFSGKYDIHNFLDGYWDELCYFHCPTANVPNMDARMGRGAFRRWTSAS